MARFMFDSDQIDALRNPRVGHSLVATYANLIDQAIVKEFGARLVVIDRGNGDPLGAATVADTEPGALTIDQAVVKVELWTDEGRPYPTVYHNRDIWAQVTAAMEKAGLEPWNWVATLDGTLQPDGLYPAAVQFAGAAVLGWHADGSVVWNDRWHQGAG